MATFVGFTHGTSTPLSAIVVLERPNIMYGGSAAAPVFSQIMGYALRQLDIAPTSGYLPAGFGKGSASAGTSPAMEASGIVAPSTGNQTVLSQFPNSQSSTADRLAKTKGSVSP